MNIKNIITSIVVAALVAGAAFFVGPARTETVNKVGALAGPDIPSQYLQWGGVYVYNYRQTLQQGTTTVCAIQTPAATTTLRWASIRVDLASSSATVLDIGNSASTGATTTKIGTTYAIAAGAQAFVQASTSPTGTLPVFAPSNWLVVKIGGGVTGGNTATAAQSAGFVPTGACTATFEAIP